MMPFATPHRLSSRGKAWCTSCRGRLNKHYLYQKVSSLNVVVEIDWILRDLTPTEDSYNVAGGGDQARKWRPPEGARILPCILVDETDL